MAFKDTWKPRIDGVDDADSSAVNEIAEAVIKNEQSIKKNANDISSKQDALSKEQLQNIGDVPNKAPKATTLEGYGITDAYTQKQSNEKFQDKLSEEQIKNINDVQNKVPKEDGKGLSTNDYTDEEKEKVSKIDDKADKTYVDGQLNNKVDKSTYNSQIATLGYAKANKTYVDNTFANALKGTAIGQNVTITDISPIEHIMDVKVESKNIMPYSSTKKVTSATMDVNGNISIDNSQGTGAKYSYFYTDTVGKVSFFDISKGQYVASVDMNTNGDVTVYFQIGNANDFNHKLVFSATSTGKKTLLITISEPTQIRLMVQTAAGVSCNFTAQIEKGSVATEYTKYVEDLSQAILEEYDENGLITEHFVSTDGTVEDITSIYPYMSFNISNEGGAVADVTYNRDINKAFAELENKLTQAIISLGNNI